tara:strand:+ start:515 stop:766 length:252 start_codon:yes stop_codon:yes gene_type:complete
VKLKKRENMKTPKDIKKDYEIWLKKLRVEQLKKFYLTFQAILAGQCNDDIDVVRGKIFKLCEVMGEDVYDTMEQIHDELYGIE